MWVGGGIASAAESTSGHGSRGADGGEGQGGGCEDGQASGLHQVSSGEGVVPGSAGGQVDQGGGAVGAVSAAKVVNGRAGVGAGAVPGAPPLLPVRPDHRA